MSGQTIKRWAAALAWRLAALATAMLLWLAPAVAQQQVQLIATDETGYGRLLLTFTGRLDLPPYRVRFENGVLAIEFDSAVDVLLPDVAVALPKYTTVARVDPDSRGIRIGLRGGISINRIEAGEKLFIDLLPPTWQGLPPALPEAVVAELTERAKRAAEQAEEQRRAELASELQPVVDIRVGRNPTFMRVQFDWSQDTEASFVQEGTEAALDFGWPVPIDLYPLKADLPAEVLDVTNTVRRLGSRIGFSLAEGVVPRFYQQSPRQFVLDIDTTGNEGVQALLDAEAALRLARSSAAQAAAGDAHDGAGGHADAGGLVATDTESEVVPRVETMGNTIRVNFPFEQDTAAAVFRRGDVLWLIFDTRRPVGTPPAGTELDSISTGFTVIPARDTQIVRMDLAADRLATLGSEGRSWVLSLGDVVLDATQPIELARERDEYGHYLMVADLQRPGTVHVLRDPVVGDSLHVVTVLPPARGVSRTQSFVDFEALRSSHGLVIRPRAADLDVALSAGQARITTPAGLTLSNAETARLVDAGAAPEMREAYLDFGVMREQDPSEFARRREQMLTRAATAEGRQRDAARLDLAQYLVANGFAYEALGVLRVLEKELTGDELRKKLQLMQAVANTAAWRPREAVGILNSGTFPLESDALMWRAIARADLTDFAGARQDALAAEAVFPSYPADIRSRFLFAAIRSAVEMRDVSMAIRLHGKLDFSTLSPEDVSKYQLMQARISELEGRLQEALDVYGQVIASDVRPTRAEALYRTLALLNANGGLDLDKAIETLSAEILMWRGGPLEAGMQKLLAELYFEAGDYRDAFATVEQAAASYPNAPGIGELITEAQQQFEDLYNNGAADRMPDLDALTLYYDYRQLTPPGTRGDEMIRNLARRLVKVDLLTQAGDLLQYQVDNRLSGIARAQVATDLALIRLADRDPENALRVLNATRLADLPVQLDRQRRILEARALIDAGRQELALDLISRLSGRDADLLRVDAYWQARNYPLAASLIETLYSPVQGGPQMTQEGRMSVLRAAVGYALAADTLGLSRIRAKFAEQMANSAQWPIFDFVTRNISIDSLEFKKVARELAGLDTLNAFLSAYRQQYAGDAVVPNTVRPGNAA